MLTWTFLSYYHDIKITYQNLSMAIFSGIWLGKKMYFVTMVTAIPQEIW